MPNATEGKGTSQSVEDADDGGDKYDDEDDIIPATDGPIVVSFSKLGNTIPPRARVHILNIGTHMPIIEDINDIVNVLLGPAHFNNCRGSGERDISGKSSDRECPLREFLAVLLNEFCCFFSNEHVVRSVLGCSRD